MSALGPGASVDLFDDGLLWLVNRVILHPRGFALALDRTTGGFTLHGNGAEVWRFDSSIDEDALFAAVEAAFDRARAAS